MDILQAKYKIAQLKKLRETHDQTMRCGVIQILYDPFRDDKLTMTRQFLEDTIDRMEARLEQLIRDQLDEEFDVTMSFHIEMSKDEAKRCCELVLDLERQYHSLATKVRKAKNTSPAAKALSMAHYEAMLDMLRAAYAAFEGHLTIKNGTEPHV